jgi:hypothetical protein
MPAPPVAPVDVSAREQICGDNCWRKYQVTGEELWATDEPSLFAIWDQRLSPSREAFFFSAFRYLGLERKLRAVLI